MNARIALLILLCCGGSGTIFGQQADPAAARHLTLREAVDMALQHNHAIRIANSSVDEKQAAKDVAKSAYFPKIRNDTFFARLTDTQFIELPAGSFGSVVGIPIPQHSLIIDQGGLNTTTSGTGLIQPLTQMWKVKASNDAARADVEASRGKQRGIENDIAFAVHQLYYRILIGEVRRSAIEAKLQATEGLARERGEQVKYGSALEADLIESRAQSLQSKQELLSTDLALSDLRMQFNDVIGLPLTTAVVLDPAVSDTGDSCLSKEECVKLALESHPEVTEARANVDKAAAALRAAKYDFIPDAEVFARYTYAYHVPFLAENFGTFGVHVSIDLFDGGKDRAVVRQRYAQLAQAKENLERINGAVELRVQAAYNRLERTRQMLAVSQELLALRKESSRVVAQQLANGSALGSQAQAAVAQELEAQTALLQSQLDYVQAHDEMAQAIGQTPLSGK